MATATMTPRNLTAAPASWPLAAFRTAPETRPAPRITFEEDSDGPGGNVALIRRAVLAAFDRAEIPPDAMPDILRFLDSCG
jgi:hypothetical protein